MVAVVLAHSPLVGPASWGRLPVALRARGRTVVVLDAEDEQPPYATAYVASAARQLRDAELAEPAALVGHSGAGYLLPQLGATQRAARKPVAGYVFFDAGVPHARGATRLGLMRTEDADFAAEFADLLASGGVFPTWTDEDLVALIPEDDVRRALVSALRPRREDFFVEPLPCPDDWPDAPCALVKVSAAYEQPARVARSRGWTVVEADLPGGHFAACADPDACADLLLEVVDRL